MPGEQECKNAPKPIQPGSGGSQLEIKKKNCRRWVKKKKTCSTTGEPGPLSTREAFFCTSHLIYNCVTVMQDVDRPNQYNHGSFLFNFLAC